MERGITVKFNGNEYKDTLVLNNISASKTVLQILVGVNGDYNNNDYSINYGASWITHKRIRNLIDIIISPNTIKYRSDTIILSHKLNPDMHFSIVVYQSMPDYSVLLSDIADGEYTNELILNGNRSFNPLIDETDEDRERRLIYVKCNNGRPFVSSITEFAKKAKDSNYIQVSYDNGLQLHLIDDTCLEVVNYGKANLYYDSYYIVHIKNSNSVYDAATITIYYSADKGTFSIK